MSSEKDTDRAAAAQARAEYVNALETEREGYARASMKTRVAEVDAELKRVKGAPAGRKSAATETAEA
jgi:hypothetical protein